jgi:hypothetical protein
MVSGQSHQISSRTRTIGGLGKITACCSQPNSSLDARSFGWSKRKSLKMGRLGTPLYPRMEISGEELTLGAGTMLARMAGG